MSHRIQVPAQRVGRIRAQIMQHLFWAVAAQALIIALALLAVHAYMPFAVLTALFLAATLIDLHVHRRGPYRERSAVLLFIAFVAIVITGVFAQVGVTA